MKEKTIISAATLLSSLLAYWYAKSYGKDTGPMVMLGGFVGSLVGEQIADMIIKDKKP